MVNIGLLVVVEVVPLETLHLLQERVVHIMDLQKYQVDHGLVLEMEYLVT